MADVFLSYSSEDRKWVRDLAVALEQEGWTVWWDRKTPIGTSFQTVVELELDSAECIVVVWTADSVTSDWVKAEAEEGRRRDILVPVTLGEPKIPLAFRHLQAANLDDWTPGTRAGDYSELLAAIRQIALPRRSSLPAQDQAGPRVSVPVDVTRLLLELRAHTRYLWEEFEVLTPEKPAFTCSLKQSTFERVRDALDRLASAGHLQFKTEPTESTSDDSQVLLKITVSALTEPVRQAVRDIVRERGIKHFGSLFG